MLNKLTLPDTIISIGNGAFNPHYFSELTLYGYDDTYAETYANTNHIKFVSLGEGKLRISANPIRSTDGLIVKIITNKDVSEKLVQAAVYSKETGFIKWSPATMSDCFHYDVSFELPWDGINEEDIVVKAFVWENKDTLKPLGCVANVNKTNGILVDCVMQSEHPYRNNVDEIQTYTYDGECTSIDITFSGDTMTESGFDYIYVYDADYNSMGLFTGSLAGKTINIPGNTFRMRLISDGSNTKYGYRIESIIVNK